ncbi:MAG: MATE family efflux transporter [[Clostridium] fimetarium]|nr:MATE family efflux transporter [[Clostridium] fimetarium]
MFKRCLSIFRLALPVMVAQVGFILVSFADNIMVGRYTTQSLAASSFVVNIFNVVIFFAMGFSYGLTPLIGALFGQKRSDAIGLTLRAGLIANVIVGVLLSLLMLCLYFRLGEMGQPDELIPLIKPFFLIYLAGLLPMTVFNAFTQWSYAIKNTAMPMWILLGCNALNILGNYVLIYGHWGFPELGLTGAGLSTLAARVIAPVVILIVFFTRADYRGYREAFLRGGRIPEGMMGRVVKTSWPVALQMTFETGAFSLCAVFAGWIGTVSLAAFQIVLVVGTLGFCIYYSVGTAIAVLTANEAGHGLGPNCRRPAFDGYVVMLFFMSLSSLVFVLFSRPLMGLFTEDETVLSLATSLLFPLVLYQLGDATQITFANALRGTARVMPMLWIAFVSYILVGLPSTYLLAFPAGLGVYGIELSFSVSLFLAGGLFLAAFLKVTRGVQR